MTKVLHKDFEYVISSLLGQSNNKSIDEIQSILSSAKAKFLSKKAVGVIAKLAHILRNNSYKQNLLIATSKDNCFKYYKIGRFGRDCKYPNYQLMKKKNTKQDRNNNSAKPRLRQANVIATADKESDSELFCP